MIVAGKSTDKFVWGPGDVEWQDAKPVTKTSAQKLAERVAAQKSK